MAGEIICVVGARPNLVKIAPIARALAACGLAAPLLHTGQHYDRELDRVFIEQLDIPEPAWHLGVGSGTHAVQTAQVMIGIEPILAERRPAAVLVVGDVNSTLAAALVAAKLLIPLVHVEAGLRSRNRAMPEEINRVLTDQVADVLYTTEREAAANLAAEGIPPEHVVFAGNVMIDTLRHCLPRAVPAAATWMAAAPAERRRAGGRFAVLTLHRPANVDDPAVLGPLLDTLRQVAERLPVIFPMHPRTRAVIERSSLQPRLAGSGLVTVPPLSYLEMLGLMRDATVVLTDSGGIQEETTALGVPCLTLRAETERPITVTEGTNTVVGTDPARILAAVDAVLRGDTETARIPEGWDGRAAERIAADLQHRLVRRERAEAK